GLEQGVLGERHPGLDDLADLGVVLDADELGVQPPDHVGEDRAQLGDLVGVAGGQDDPAPGRGHGSSAPASWASAPATSSAPRAACCRAVSSAHPSTARSSRASRSSRSNGSPSAVPCTSTKRPSPVITTFMSVSASTSSSSSRSSTGSPSTVPTLTAATEPVIGSASTAMRPRLRAVSTASTSAT